MDDIDARIAACENAPDAPEALRERVARAIYEEDRNDDDPRLDVPWWVLPPIGKNAYRRLADAAIAVITTPATT